MTETGNFFLALLRFALWGEKSPAIPDELDADTVEDLLFEAKNQTVLGLVADALSTCGARIPQTQAIKLFGSVMKLADKNARMNAEIERFANLQIPEYAIVKGQTIAALYPNPDLRMPGDVDFYVRDYSTARQIIQNQWNVTLPEKLLEKEYAFDFNNVSYEIHDSLLAFGSRKNQRYWDQLMTRPFNSITIGRTRIPTLEPTLYAVYVFIHLFFHFVREGIGLRHLCDWAVLLNHYQKNIDAEELTCILKKLGFLDAYRAFGAIIVDYLGARYFPLEINEKDRKWANKILPHILYGGNFGNNNKSNTFTSIGMKIHTFLRGVSVCCKYLPLASTELLLTIPRYLRVNLRLIVKK